MSELGFQIIDHCGQYWSHQNMKSYIVIYLEVLRLPSCEFSTSSMKLTGHFQSKMI